MSIAFLETAASAVVKDLRSEPRKALRVAVAVAPSSAATIQGTTANVSVHGLDLISDTDLQPATRCKVAFSLPVGGQMRPVQLHACVVRRTLGTEGFSLGLVFFGMPQRTKELLESFVFC